MAEIDTTSGTGPGSTARKRRIVGDDTVRAHRTADRRADRRLHRGSVADRSGASTRPGPTRRGRIRKWDRPPPPHDWRWYVGNLGKTLIAVGLLMFGFVAYQLWGTAIETAAAQNELQDEFEQQLAGVPPTDAVTDTTSVTASTDAVVEPPPVDPGSSDQADQADGADQPDGAVVEPDPEPPTDDTTTDDTTTDDTTTDDTTTDTVAPAVPVDQQAIPALADGDALARLEIPRIGVDSIVVAGVETGDLKRGPGHFPDTPLPGQLGNSAIAGHRTTYGQPFFNVDQLQVGDPIRVTTLNGVFTYRVTGQQIVSPSDYGVVATSDPTRANLTLTSCHPKYTARERIVVFSELDTTESAAVGAPVLNYGRPAGETPGDAELPADGPIDTTVGDVGPVPVDSGPVGSQTVDSDTVNVAGDSGGDIDDLNAPAVNAGIADAFSDGWFSDPSANGQVGLWGLALAAISIFAYFVSRTVRRDWAGLLVGIVPFVVTLYFFFQNVNRLLPPNL